MIEHYPIPPDGEILRSEHLHAQTLFTLAQAGRALRGSWGFFRPSSLTGLANHVYTQDRHVVIENLAVLSPKGFTLQAEKLSQAIPEVGRSLRLSWTLPSHASENDGLAGVRLNITSGDAPMGPSDVEIGEIRGQRRTSVVLTAPAFTLDGAAPLAGSWSRLGEAFGGVTGVLDGSSCGRPFERQLVSSAFKQLDSMLPDSPRQATRALQVALDQLAGFAQEYADKNVVKEATVLLERAGACCENVGEGLTALCKALDRLTSKVLNGLNATRDWLIRGAEAHELKPENEIGEAGKLIVKDYSLGGTTGPLHIALIDVEAGPEPVKVWARFDNTGWQDLAGSRLDDRMDVPLERPEGAARLMLRCTAGVETTVKSRRI